MFDKVRFLLLFLERKRRKRNKKYFIINYLPELKVRVNQEKMKKKKTVKKGSGAKTVVGVSVGVAALGAAAAYLFLGPKGEKNKKAVKTWAKKMKSELVREFKKAKNVTEPVYHNIVDKVHARYAKFEDVDKKELESLVKDVKKHWKTMTKETKKPAKK